MARTKLLQLLACTYVRQSWTIEVLSLFSNLLADLVMYQAVVEVDVDYALLYDYKSSTTLKF